MLWVQAAVVAGKMVLGSLSQNNAAMEEARQYGEQTANREFTSARQVEAGQQSMIAAQKNAGVSKLAIDMNTNQTKADRAVEAAAAGATGGSVDASLVQADINNEIARMNIDLSLEDQAIGIQTTTQNALINTHTGGMGEPATTGTNPMLMGALAGLYEYRRLGGFSQ